MTTPVMKRNATSAFYKVTHEFRIQPADAPGFVLLINDTTAMCLILQGLLLEFTGFTQVGVKRLSDDTRPGRSVSEYLNDIPALRKCAQSL